MSATLSGALKAGIEALGLGLSAYRDEAPSDATRPYVTLHEGISRTREQHGDQGDADAHGAATELVQASLWQDWRDETGALIEQPGLAEDLVAGINGLALATAPRRVYSCTVDDSQRFLEDESNTVHEAITVRIRRDL